MKTIRISSLNFILILAVASAFAKTIHVAKTGNDGGNGSFASPYLTLSKAASLARAGDEVVIQEGTYQEILKPTASGTEGAPILFRAAEGAYVVISAMENLRGWKQDREKIFVTEVTWDLGVENFVSQGEEVYDLARWPNNIDGDYFSMNAVVATGGREGGANSSLEYSPGIPKFNWSKGGIVHHYGGDGWLAWKANIKSSTSNQVTFSLAEKNPSWIRNYHKPSKGGNFYLQGVREALDNSREWYFDNSTKQLYVQMPHGGNPKDNELQFRRRTTSIDFNWKNYIRIEGITTFGGSININGDYNTLSRVRCLWGNYSTGVVEGFLTGTQSVLLTGDNNIVEKSLVAFGTGNGVYDKGNNNKVVNSLLKEFNMYGFYDAVLNTRGARNGKYIRNTMTRGGRDIVQAFGHDSEYAYNDISYSNLVADDCGLIYSVGGRGTSYIHHNWFHDAFAVNGRYKAAGIYLDTSPINWVVHHNVVWNTQWTSIQMNWNATNINIFNNTFLDGSATMGAWHMDGTQFTNVKVWNNLTNYTGDNSGNGKEDENIWEPQSDKRNNMVDSSNPFENMEDKNFMLNGGSSPINKGRGIPGITDGYIGNAPDVGAYEFGGEKWTAGITWDPEKELVSRIFADGFSDNKNPAIGEIKWVGDVLEIRLSSTGFYQIGILTLTGKKVHTTQFRNSERGVYKQIRLPSSLQGLHVLRIENQGQGTLSRLLKL